MNENTMLQNKNDSSGKVSMSDLLTTAALGIFSLVVIWFSSSLLIHLAK